MGPAHFTISIGIYHDVLLDVVTWNAGFELALLVVGSINHSMIELGRCVAAYYHTIPTREFMLLKRHKLLQVLIEGLPWVSLLILHMYFLHAWLKQAKQSNLDMMCQIY